MKKIFKLFFLLILLSIYTTCSDEDMVTDINILKNSKVLNTGNADDASGLIVLFSIIENKYNVTAVRIALIKSTDFSTFTVTEARSLPEERFTTVTNILPNKILESHLPSDLLDVDGRGINKSTKYNVIFMMVMGEELLLEQGTTEASLGSKHFLAGNYTGTWTDNFYINFPISAILNVSSGKLSGAFYYSGTFKSCCSGNNDGIITMDIADDGITVSNFRYDQFLANFNGKECPGTYSGASILSKHTYDNIEITFKGNDCEGAHTGGQIFLSKS